MGSFERVILVLVWVIGERAARPRLYGVRYESAPRSPASSQWASRFFRDKKLGAQVVSAGATVGAIGLRLPRSLTQYPQTPKDAGLMDF